MQEVLDKLRREKIELSGKIRNLEKFRGSDEWKKLSVAHKQLLDIQLQAMRTYLEAIIGRYIDIEETLNNKAENESNNEDSIKVIIIGMDE